MESSDTLYQNLYEETQVASWRGLYLRKLSVCRWVGVVGAAKDFYLEVAGLEILSVLVLLTW